MKVPIDRWPEVERWLLAALDFPANEREHFLAQCPGELLPLLRMLIRGLQDPKSREGRLLDRNRIQGVVEATFALDRPESMAESSGEEGTPEQIGSYQLIRLLGKGGMGIVYLCQRGASGGNPQRVALKILRSDLQSDDAMLRFRRERVLLAAVDSPHVPRLLDAGTSADGRPYFVMEYVEGEPITDYVARVQPSRQARFDLVEEVCEAVLHLHEQLIVHRDIKPANIFVTVVDGVPRVKLLDFGVSTFLLSDKELSSRSLLSLTQDATAPHTPAFAAPEQKNGSAPSGAIDIFALGMLFCLLHLEEPRARSSQFPFCSGSGVFRSGQHCSLGGICPIAAHADPGSRFSSIQEMTAAIRAFRSVAQEN